MEQTLIISDTPSKDLYRIAGVMALIIVLAGLIDAVTSQGIEARDNRLIPVIEWFTLFQSNGFAAFSRLGIINMLTLTCGIPVYLAFIQAFRKDRPALAMFAAILFWVGAAVYLSSNTVFALFAVNQQYTAASTVQKPLLEAAGNAVLAQGADLTPGTFVGLGLAQIAGLLITSGMLRVNPFGKWTGRAGLAGFSLMTVFFILSAFFPAHYAAAIAISVPGGLLLMAYQLMLARKFFQLGR